MASEEYLQTQNTQKILNFKPKKECKGQHLTTVSGKKRSPEAPDKKTNPATNRGCEEKDPLCRFSGTERPIVKG